MRFVEVWQAGSLSKVPPLEVHLAPWMEGEFIGLLPMFQPKAHGLILLEKGLELFSLLVSNSIRKRIEIVILFVVDFGFVRKSATL